jgi:uncharacterized protein YbjT (DUF2867 family)
LLRFIIMSKQILVVFGATGQQGGSVIEQVLQDKELSRKYAIRALSRDPSSSASQSLAKKGVEVFKCDTKSDSDVKTVLKGCHTTFLMTSSSMFQHLSPFLWRVTNSRAVYSPTGAKDEEALGNHLADLIVESGAQYLIWSSMVSPTKISGGKFPNVATFESKFLVEQYIRTLPIKSSFFIPASFMQNFQDNQKPRPLGDDTYAFFNIYAPDDKLPLIDIAADTGKWIAAILAEPDKYEGKTIAAATDIYSQTEIVEAMSKTSGKTIRHIQIPLDQFEGYLAESFRIPLSEMTQYCKEFGYFGANMEEEVSWAAAQARGRLTTLEEYFKREPLQL